MLDRKSFFTECYLKTGGWIPMTPLTYPIALGDYCRITNQQLAPLGNISNLNMLLEIKLSDNLPLNPEGWKLSKGVQQLYQEKETLAEVAIDSEYKACAKQKIGFQQKGDFLFHGRAPQCRLIMNWHSFKDSITMSLTSSQYNFQELYVVTGVALVNNWGLAIAGDKDAQLEIVTNLEEYDYFCMLSHESLQAQSSSFISAFEHSYTQPAHFFKAKKLVLKDSRHDEFLAQIVKMSTFDPGRYIGNWLNTNWLNLLDREIVLKDSKTCISYFDWRDVTLDDVEKLV